MKESVEARVSVQCFTISKLLIYNGEHWEGEIKHTMIEAGTLLAKHACRVFKGNHGVLVINCNGKSRKLTIRERIALWLLNGNLEIRP